MALLYCDSFDHYTTVSDKGWAGSGGFGITSGGRTSNCAYTQGNWQGGYNGTLQRSFTGTTELIFGCAIKVGGAVGSIPWNITFYEGGTSHLQIDVDGSGRLQFRRGAGGTILGTTTSPLVNSVFVHLQFRLKVHDSTGTLTVKIGNIAEITLTGIDTRNGGSTGAIDTVQFNSGQITFAGAWNMYYDDLWICDVAGSVNNDFLGDCTVQALLPNGNGNSSQLVGSDSNSTDNYLLVDESTPNSDTDYVESSTPGDKDTYAFGNLPQATGTIKGVQVCPFLKKTDAGTRSVVSVVRLSGTEEDSAVKNLGTSYAYQTDIRETKPGGGAWSLSDVNAAEFGIKVNA